MYSLKATSASDQKKPLMIYIHGGGYAFFNSDAFNLYSIEFVKRLDMIVLAIE
jgi:carboxylesterase type B